MRGIIFENITAENLNKSDFVKQIKNPGSYYCTIAYDGHFYGVYSNPNEGYLYILCKHRTYHEYQALLWEWLCILWDQHY